MAAAAQALQPQASPLAPPSTPPSQQQTPELPQLTPPTANYGKFDEKFLEDKEQQFEEKSKAATGLIDSAKIPAAPDLKPLPDPKNTSPAEVWGSAAMAFALLGSAFTRAPMTSAMNAAAGVMKAYKQNDADLANAQFERWKASNDYALKLHDSEMETYHAIIEKAAVDQKAAGAEWEAATAAFSDSTARETQKVQGWDAVQRLMDDRMKWSYEMAKDQDALNFSHQQWINYIHISNAQDELNKAQQSGDKTKLAAAQKQLTDATQNAKNLMLAQGKSTGVPRSAVGMALQQYIADPANDQSDEGIQHFLAGFNATMSEARKIGGVAGGVDIADRAVVKFADQVREASKNVPRSQIPFINKFILMGATESGDTKINPLLIAVDGLINERARGIGGGQIHVGDQIEGRKLIAASLTDGTINSSADQFVKEVRAVHQSSQEAMADISGKTKPLDKKGIEDFVKKYGVDGAVQHADERDMQAVSDYISAGFKNHTLSTHGIPFGWTGAWKPNPAWPSASGVPDGKIVTDDKGHVVAEARGGQWVEPK